MGGPDVRQPDPRLYRTARVRAAAAIFALVVALGLADVVLSEYVLDPVLVGLLLTSGLFLLGVDAKGLRG